MRDNIIGIPATVVPTVRYRDVPAAIAWLEEAFGFVPHRLLRDENGAVCYAELTFGTGMIMVSPVGEDGLGKLMVQPGDVGGVETQICYLSVDDPVAHCARARAAGASIVLDITDEESNGRGYSCRDPEGHVWSFGTYDPWLRFQHRKAPARPNHRGARTFAALTALGLLAVAFIHEPTRAAVSDAAENVLVRIASPSDPLANDGRPVFADGAATLQGLRIELAREQTAKAKAEQALAQLREQLVLETRLREAAEQASAQSRDQLAALLAKQESVGRTASAIRSELERVQAAKAAAEAAAKEAREKLARAQAAETARQAKLLARRERIARNRAAREAAHLKEVAASAYPSWICGRIKC